MRTIRSSTHSTSSTASRLVASASLSMLLLFAAACGSDAPSATAGSTAETAVQTQTATTLSPEQLGALGAEIRREPARADEILGRHQLTRESFEQAIRGVTEDADASRRYAAAYRSASS